MRNKLAIVLALITVVSLAPNAWSQNPITADSPFQVRYAAHLNVGDSFVNISNSGASGGNICTNVYTFAPDEQLISCCSCVVTPNALVSLSARNDLISNTLTPAVPTSIVVKLLASTGGACNAATPGALTAGMLAWGTTIHPQTNTTSTPNTSSNCVRYCSGGYPQYASWCQQNCQPKTTTTTTYATTETPFSPASLSAAELARISSLCGFIQANGSGYGICRSCRQGAQSTGD
jgi:hypothetical protein